MRQLEYAADKHSVNPSQRGARVARRVGSYEDGDDGEVRRAARRTMGPAATGPAPEKLRVHRMLTAFFLLLAAAPARASQGLTTKFAEVEVRGLKIGLTYSLRRLVNLPLRVDNTGSDPIELRVEPVAPGRDEMKPGFEAIPDARWIRLEFSTFTVYPGMSGATDVILSIPNDEKLVGRRFCAYLWTQSQNKGFMGVALKSRLLISISSQKPSEEELKAKFVTKNIGNLNFSFAPMEALADGAIPLGKRVRLKDYKVDMKLVNPNDVAYHFRLSSVGLWETTIGAPSGFTEAPDPKWLAIKNPVFKAGAFSFTPADLELEIPDEPQNRNLSILFLVRAEILEQEVPAYAYAKILVRTRK